MKYLSVLVFVSCAIGCQTGPETLSPDDAVTVTRVYLDANGGKSVFVDHVTRAVRDDARLQRGKILTTGREWTNIMATTTDQDPGCTGGYNGYLATDLNDATSLSGNDICVWGNGTLDLTQVCHIGVPGECSDFWSNKVRSLQAGSGIGHITGAASCTFSFTYGPTHYGTYNTVSSCAQTDQSITITNEP